MQSPTSPISLKTKLGAIINADESADPSNNPEGTNNPGQASGVAPRQNPSQNQSQTEGAHPQRNFEIEIEGHGSDSMDSDFEDSDDMTGEQAQPDSGELETPAYLRRQKDLLE